VEILAGILALSLAGGTVPGSAPPASPPDRPSLNPNIVLVLVDDWGWQDLSVPMLERRTPLNDRFRTPNLEAIAARGVRASDAYAAAPVCTPSRVAIMTGQSPARTGVTYWTLERDRDTSSRHPRLDPPAWEVNGIGPDPALLPRRLADAGYTTIHVGKAHFGARGTPGADPRSLGFAMNVAGHAAGAPGSFLASHRFKDAARKRAERGEAADPATAPASVWDVPGLERWHGTDAWLDTALAEEASDAISAAIADGTPFFLNFCPYGVHTPIMEDARFARDFPGLDARERAYATMVAAVDDAIGRIVETCREKGVLDRTIFVITGDNGGLSAHSRGAAPDGSTAHHHNAPLRSGKGSACDGGVRVPFIVAGPGIAHRSSPISAPIVGTDLYPTILAFAGVKPPPGRTLDGIDLGPLLRGEVATLPERTILFHQPHAWGPTGPGIEPFSSVRRGDLKLVWFHDAIGGGDRTRLELYDLRADPGESHDLAAGRPDDLASMLALLRDALATANARLSVDRASGRPVTPPSPALAEDTGTPR
jgi:arylsulfatase A-like enzyme